MIGIGKAFKKRLSRKKAENKKLNFISQNGLGLVFLLWPRDLLFKILRITRRVNQEPKIIRLFLRMTPNRK